MRQFLILASLCALFVACGGDSDTEATCAGVCPDVVAAECENGPPTLSECISGCENIFEMGCATELQAMLDCSAGKSFTCDEDDSPVASGCESQNDAVNTCIASLID